MKQHHRFKQDNTNLPVTTSVLTESKVLSFTHFFVTHNYTQHSRVSSETIITKQTIGVQYIIQKQI